ncbi:type II secretion system GspH family protein [Sporosarcina sp. ACRSL]|uniref:type II secretion system protein n=1 Tax=Sporosarcina sp. ACRSL TaxID=2918215 RepID=UPI001EF4095E|nr:type II secretion system protein [Sporosarcina sp. ACRSL]MCG7345005.1 type II secretion system GspH family protein [Sporosarcina sp. ACRSL]
MKKLLQKRLKNEKGLTLVELLAVIVILGIIAAIAVPSIGNIIQNSKLNALKADAINVLSAADLYFVEKGSADDATVTTETLKVEGYLEDSGGFPADESVTVKKVKTGNTISGTAANGDTNIIFSEATKNGINNTEVKSGETISN